MIENPTETLLVPLRKTMLERKGISDTFFYIEPNFIKIRINVLIDTLNNNITDSDIKLVETQAIIDQYSIFNTSFKKPFYFSELNYIVKSFPFVNNCKIFIEAIADNRYNEDTIDFTNIYNEDKAYVDFDFFFDTVYGIADSYKKGFQNYLQNTTYLLKVELTWLQDPVKAAKLNRTLFLFDYRNLCEKEDLDINSAKYYSLSGLPLTKINLDIESMGTIIDRDLEDVDNRAARVAQFPLITDITDDDKMIYQIKDYSRVPVEIRSVYTDVNGNNKIYNVSEVAESERIDLPGGKTCYRLDSRYYQGLDIFFYENYDSPTSPDFARGFVRIPRTYFEFLELNPNSATRMTKEDFIEKIKGSFQIKVYAKPLIQDVIPRNENDIVFCDLDEILVERVSSNT